MSGSSHVLDTQILGSDTGKRNTLRWLKGYVDKQEVCGKPRIPPPEASAQELAPNHNEEDRLRPHLWMSVFKRTAHAYTRPGYSVWPICTGAGATMTRQTVGMWATEVHLAQGGMWVVEPGSCSWRALT